MPRLRLKYLLGVSFGGRFGGYRTYAKPLTTATISTLVVGGFPEARVIFIKELHAISAPRGSAEDKQTGLIKALVELFLNNGVLIEQSAKNLANDFGFVLHIQVHPLHPVIQPTPPPHHQITHGKVMQMHYKVTVQSRNGKFPELLNKLMEIAVDNKLIDADAAVSILVTFRKFLFKFNF